MTNKEYKELLDNNKIIVEELINLLEERVRVFTRVDIGNMNLRVDLVSKLNEQDISLFIVLNKIYSFKELKENGIYLPEKIHWIKK